MSARQMYHIDSHWVTKNVPTSIPMQNVSRGKEHAVQIWLMLFHNLNYYQQWDTCNLLETFFLITCAYCLIIEAVVRHSRRIQKEESCSR